jgi:hypothetical protein
MYVSRVSLPTRAQSIYAYTDHATRTHPFMQVHITHTYTHTDTHNSELEAELQRLLAERDFWKRKAAECDELRDMLDRLKKQQDTSVPKVCSDMCVCVYLTCSRCDQAAPNV